MCWLPKRCFCWTLRTGTLAQGAFCLITAGVNILAVIMGIEELIEAKIYKLCFPLENCYDRFMALEKSLTLGNIVINSLLFIVCVPLLNGVKNDKPSHMFPFMFIQGLMISGLAAAAVAALVICFQVGTWFEYLPILFLSSLYISLHVYLALVIRAYYNEVMNTKKKKKNLCKMERGGSDKGKEMTLEDYVF